MATKPADDKVSNTIDLSQSAEPEPIDLTQAAPKAKGLDLPEPPRTTGDGSFGPEPSAGWDLAHVFPQDVDESVKPILETAAALCRFKKASWTLLSTSTLMIGAIEYGLRQPELSGSDADPDHPIVRILNLLRGRGMMGDGGDRPYDRLKKEFFREDLPERLELQPADVEGLEVTRNVKSVVDHSEMQPVYDTNPIKDLLILICSEYLHNSIPDHEKSRVMAPDRFSFEMYLDGTGLDGLQDVDYTAALFRRRAADPTIEDLAFFAEAQNAPIVGIYIDPEAQDPHLMQYRDPELARSLSLKPDDLVGQTVALLVPPGYSHGSVEANFLLQGWGKITQADEDLGAYDIEPQDLHPPIQIPYDLHFGTSRPEPFGSNFISYPGTNAHEALRRLITDLDYKPVPPKPTEEPPELDLTDDRPEVLVDHLERGPLALALANSINKIYATQRPRPITSWFKNQLPDAVFEYFWADYDPSPETSYILHIDAPWGGGKTTFANYVGAFLNPRIHDPQYFNRADKAELQSQISGETILSRFFDDLHAKRKDNTQAWAENAWIPVWFNAWEHQHVQPPWWDFRHSIRRGYRKHLGWYDWANEGVAELIWRIFNPSFMATLWILVALVAVFLGLSQIPVLAEFLSGLGQKNNSTAQTIISGVIGAGSIGALIAGARAGLHNMVLSASSSSDPGKLGVTDPQRRFSKRFVRSINSFRRPVLVIIDDLDRCDPGYVVELLRGLLTIFKSRRVVYVLLGDKAWIEQALEIVYDDMEPAHNETDVSFGARFAEKVIQMSFLLPKIEAAAHEKYLRGLIPAERSSQHALLQDADFSAHLDATAREMRQAQSDTERQVVKAKIERQRATLNLSPEQAAFAAQRDTGVEIVQKALSAETEAKTAKGLLEFVDLLPNNPRRVKRINNLVMMYQLSVAQLRLTGQSEQLWKKVALWVILMSEQPRLWQLICGAPEILTDMKKVWTTGSPPKDTPTPALWGAAKATLAQDVVQRDDLMCLLCASLDAQGALVRQTGSTSLVDRLKSPQVGDTPLLDHATVNDLLKLTPVA